MTRWSWPSRLGFDSMGLLNLWNAAAFQAGGRCSPLCRGLNVGFVAANTAEGSSDLGREVPDRRSTRPLAHVNAFGKRGLNAPVLPRRASDVDRNRLLVDLSALAHLLEARQLNPGGCLSESASPIPVNNGVQSRVVQAQILDVLRHVTGKTAPPTSLISQERGDERATIVGAVPVDGDKIG